jgi:hypothetical protein
VIAMTEGKWLTCAKPEPLAKFVRGKAANKRKQRLFAVGCCRRIWDLLTDEDDRAAVELAERFADGLVDDREWSRARKNASEKYSRLWEIGFRAAAYSTLEKRVGGAVNSTWRWARRPGEDWWAMQKEQADLFRCIFGNPFRPVALIPAWLTLPVINIALTIYDERRFCDMPVLADALQDACCDNEEILAHCRQTGEHVRGCWVVDLLLGKA